MNRTKSEVLAARDNPSTGGCCDRFADNMGCNCLEEAAPDETISSSEEITQRLADEMEKLRESLGAECHRLRQAIKKHHDQKADDRCFLDDDELYAAAGLEKADVRVGDKAAMLENCKKFIDQRCEVGGWPSYASLEAEIVRLKAQIESHCARIAAQSELLSTKAEKPPKLASFSRWMHKATQGTYTVLCIAKCSTNGPGEDAEAVVYISHATGRISYRDLAEFMSPGRFISLD